MKPPTKVALPPDVVIVTSAAPAVPGGVTTDTVVSLITENGAATPPMVTDWVVARLVPVNVTAVPPEVEPELGDTVVRVGVST
ncbi:hypothetical protein GCM10020000_83840 [Streptomyces olivoverticillatus]